jgi:hypothetical protein
MRKRTALLWLGLMLSLTMFYFWSFPLIKGPCMPPSVSPDRRFEIRFLETYSLRSFLWQQADNTPGYVALYDRAKRHEIKRKFVSRLQDIEPFWIEDEVVMVGDVDVSWTLR